MNRTELENMLNEMSAEEREAALAVDDAMDRYFSIQLQKKYGVRVVCNPDGDRTKIMIDDVVMDQEQFAAWLMVREAGRVISEAAQRPEIEAPAADVEELPGDLKIPYDELNQVDAEGVKTWLRGVYGHYLKKGTEPSMMWDDDNNEVIVSNIQWGRRK